MIDQTTLEGKVITAAFDLAASPGWDEISLRDIADAAGVSLADLMEHFDSKSDVLKAFVKHLDQAMLAGAGDVEREQAPRDAVFEVMMSRFDLMAPYKAGLRTIAKDMRVLAREPELIRLALSTQNKILQAAGVSVSGAPAFVRQLGLAQVYAQVFRIWLDDDDAGMAKTMAALDKRLRQGEQTLRTIEDVTKSVDRFCERSSGLAASVVANLRSAMTPRARSDGDDMANGATRDAEPYAEPFPGPEADIDGRAAPGAAPT